MLLCCVVLCCACVRVCARACVRACVCRVATELHTPVLLRRGTSARPPAYLAPHPRPVDSTVLGGICEAGHSLLQNNQAEHLQRLSIPTFII